MTCLEIHLISLVPFDAAAARWRQYGTSVAEGFGWADTTHEFGHPYGLFVDDEDTVVVADRKNRHIIEWRKRSTKSVEFADRCDLRQRNRFVLRADKLNHRVRRFSIEGNRIKSISLSQTVGYAYAAKEQFLVGVTKE